MPAITITDLNNAALDVATIGAIANSTDATVTDRLGAVRPTMTALAAEYPTASANAAAALVSELAAAASAATAEAARDAALLSRGVFASTAAGMGNGVADTASLVAGSGGTNGTFALAFSGGTQVTAPAGVFVVAGGALASITITAAGYYSAGTPTLSFAASSGLTGASATAVMTANADVGEYFSVPVTTTGSNDALILYQVGAGPVANEICRYVSANAVNTLAIGNGLETALPNLLPVALADLSEHGFTVTGTGATMVAGTYNNTPCWVLTAPPGINGAATYDIPVTAFAPYTSFSFGAMVLALNAATASGASFAALTVQRLNAAGTTISTVEAGEMSATDLGFTTPLHTYAENAAIDPASTPIVTLRMRWTWKGSGVADTRIMYVRDIYFGPGPNATYRPSIPIIKPQGFSSGADMQNDYNLSTLSEIIASIGRTAYDPPDDLDWPDAYPLRLYRTQALAYKMVINHRDFIDSRVWQSAAIHVDVATGIDTNTGYGACDGDFSRATKSISRAIRIGNATSAPYRIIVKAGLYEYAYGINNPGGAGALANARTTQPAAIIAHGGRVIHSAHKSQTWTLHSGTTYQATTTQVGWVLDIANNDIDGEAGVPLTYATSVANCAATPGTWWQDTTIIYVNRADAAAVTDANTRTLYYLNNATFDSTTKDIYLEGIDFRGGRYAALDCGDLATVRTANTVANNCTMKYAGKPASEAPAFTIDRATGVVILLGCTARRGSTDCFNFHANSTAVLQAITYNCVGTNPGFYSGTSCNAHTGHEAVIGIDINGTYTGGNGATMHWVQTSKLWAFGSSISGSTQATPEECKSSNATEMWLENCTISSTGRALRADGNGLGGPDSVIYKRGCTISAGTEVTDAGGTITTF